MSDNTHIENSQELFSVPCMPIEYELFLAVCEAHDFDSTSLTMSEVNRLIGHLNNVDNYKYKNFTSFQLNQWIERLKYQLTNSLILLNASGRKNPKLNISCSLSL
ncbi:hypothetical protein LDJ79_17810 [Vibrio tritonius]|uniref:Uncharacterized protein n=1 Tax=Vibrio tritonius TaxID=1435069 RepID=A0ABS7YQN2_9VIBR|nr:hypothetical protein [Vibrio tritonius]MCA2017981.1 hypothetical protein [Vibrio tritonius]